MCLTTSSNQELFFSTILDNSSSFEPIRPIHHSIHPFLRVSRPFTRMIMNFWVLIHTSKELIRSTLRVNHLSNRVNRSFLRWIILKKDELKKRMKIFLQYFSYFDKITLNLIVFFIKNKSFLIIYFNFFHI